MVRVTWFRTRWVGEMERSLRMLFGKLKRMQPCVAYIKNLDAIAVDQNEHLHGAILELMDNLTEFKENNTKTLILCSATHRIDPQIKTYFEEPI